MSTHTSLSSRFSQLLTASGVLLFASSCLAAPRVATSSAAPSAGGYNSNFGSDYGVGRARRAVGRQPIEIVGLRAKTRGGTLVPWVGLRFGEALSNRLAPLMGRAASPGATARRLASSGVRVQDIGCPFPATSAQSGVWFSFSNQTTASRKASPERALAVLQGARSRAGDVELIGTGAIGSRDSLVLFGDIVLDGPIERSTSSLTISVRVVRSDAAQPGRAELVMPLVKLQAPARDWAQLPSRTALAVLDALQITLKDDERVRLVRDASPLMPQASSARLRLEQKLGSAAAQVIDARSLQAQAARATNVAMRRRLTTQAATLRARAIADLRSVAKTPIPAAKSERAAFAEITRSARSWLSPAVS